MAEVSTVICTNGEHPIKNGTDCEIGKELSNGEVPCVYKTFKYRWVILLLYILGGMSSSIQWAAYVTIANVMVNYYDKTYEVVNWTSLIFYLCYVLLVYPCVYLTEIWGLRKTVIVGALLSALGAWIKVASTGSGGFWLVMVGQAIAALSQNFIISIPTSLAATWFGPDEISTACSIGTLGDALGLIVSCVLPAMVVDGTQNSDVTEQGLYRLALIFGILTSAIFVITVIGFRDRPPTPPSRAQRNAKKESVRVWQSLKRLMKDIQFLMFLIAFSCNAGVFIGLGSVIPQIVFTTYDNAAADVGILLIVLLVTGMVGSVVFGFILDRYAKFRETTIFLYVVSVIMSIAFSLFLNAGIEIVYILVGLLGFFMCPIISTGLAVAVQLAYPEPESAVTGLLLLISRVIGIMVTQLYSSLLINDFGIWAHLSMSSIVMLSTIMIFFTRFNLKRQAAENSLECKNVS